VTDHVVMVKCLVWDLDNTLWQGILLEGDQVRLLEAVRQVIVELDARGILQSVASKNDGELAWERLEHLGVAEYFVLPQIGWGPKSDSVRRIAEGLNFAHRALAFIDDQPTECAEVSFHLPEVRCYPAEQASMLPGLPEFSPAVITVDSRGRRQMCQLPARGHTCRFHRSGRRVPAVTGLGDAHRASHRAGLVPGRGTHGAYQPDERDRGALLG
jgi:methoxymalonate biosynthesis protein